MVWEERVDRAVKRQVDEAVEICKAVSTGEGLEEVTAKWLGRIRIDPFRERPTPAELVYRVGPANDGVVFATPERARYVANLHDAFDSKTWGEFAGGPPGASSRAGEPRHPGGSRARPAVPLR